MTPSMLKGTIGSLALCVSTAVAAAGGAEHVIEASKEIPLSTMSMLSLLEGPVARSSALAKRPSRGRESSCSRHGRTWARTCARR